jgi:hypothetical protein
MENILVLIICAFIVWAVASMLFTLHDTMNSISDPGKGIKKHRNTNTSHVVPYIKR